MKRIRILQIGKYYYPYNGGTESHLFTLTQELKKTFDIQILASNTKFRTSVEKHEGVGVFRIASLGSFFSVPLSWSMPFWLKKVNAEILHFHLPNPLSVISYFLSQPRGKIIVSYHSDIVKQRFLAFLFNPLLIKFLKKAEAIIVTSDNLIKNSLILKQFRDKCRIIPHGIDVDRFQSDKNVLDKAEEIRQKYGTPLILFVGRLVYYKGLEYLLKAMQDIEARLLVVGGGPLKNKLKRLAVRYGVSDKITWVGELRDEELVCYYYACDVFVLPSNIRSESFGIVQLEAFACGKPVVSTNLPTGVPFVNLHHQTGLIVPPSSSQALAYAINKLLVSPELRKIYGENGKERVRKEFNKEKMAEEVLRVYKEII